jgi:hypothetical protein
MRFVLRVWLPDKPGALGRVASAIGSVGASLVGIDILEQDSGYAIDELVVEAVDSVNAAEKLVVALTFIEGVNVEDIRESPSAVIDPRVDALETAAELVESGNRDELFDVLLHRARHDMEADWATVVDFESEEPLSSIGELPAIPWVKAFVVGSRSSVDAVAAGHHGTDDIAWADLETTRAALVIGREGRPFRARERSQLAVLARIADMRVAQFVRVD